MKMLNKTVGTYGQRQDSALWIIASVGILVCCCRNGLQIFCLQSSRVFITVISANRRLALCPLLTWTKQQATDSGSADNSIVALTLLNVDRK